MHFLARFNPIYLSCYIVHFIILGMQIALFLRISSFPTNYNKGKTISNAGSKL